MLVYMKKVRSEFDYRRCNCDFQKISAGHVRLSIAHLPRLKSMYFNLILMSYLHFKYHFQEKTNKWFNSCLRWLKIAWDGSSLAQVCLIHAWDGLIHAWDGSSLAWDGLIHAWDGSSLAWDGSVLTPIYYQNVIHVLWSNSNCRRYYSDKEKILTDHVLLLIAHLSRLKSKYLNLISMSYCILKSVVYVGLHEKS